MRRIIRTTALCALLVAAAELAQAQVKIGDNPTVINKASILELESSTKGLLFPRVNLTNTTTWSLASGSTPVAGMMVYNIKTIASGFSGTSTYPAIAGDGTGIYYWDGNGWVAAKGLNGADGKSVTGAAGAPGASTPGNEGDTYINTTTGDTYIKQGNTWVLNGNIKGAKGDPGTVGVQGLPGTSGTPGTPGSGTPGAPGAGVTIVTNDSGTWVYNPATNTWTNINGPKGDKGDPGTVGVQGMPGTSGTPGTPGSGTPGAPGAGVTIVTNDSGTWVYNPTTNTWTNINGPKGDKGDPGTVGVQGLPGTSGTPGTPGSGTPGAPGAGVTIVTNDSGTWVYNPTTNTWTNINGPKGDKGDAGVVGVQGLPGTSGTPGTPGSGTPGAPGAGITIVTNDSGTWVYNPTTNTWTNINGPKGDKGDAGVVGVQGLPGTNGTPGTPGSGTPGAPGAGVTIVTNDSGTWVYNPTTNTWTNINGPKGDKGDKGDAGVVGVQGLPGTSGTPGTPGSGTPGAPGAGVTIVTNDSGTWVYNPTTNTWTNINGPKGDKGDAGVVGVQGLPGTSGTPGTPGSGTPGAPGAGITIVTNDSGTWVYNPTTNTWTNINGPKGDTGTFVATVDNGLNFSTPTNIQLGGNLIKPTTITTDATQTLAIAGLQNGASADKVVVADASGILKSVDQSSLAVEPWQVQGTTDKALLNTQDIYQSGTVAVGKNSVYAGSNSVKTVFDVEGSIRGGAAHTGDVGVNSFAFGNGNEASALRSISMGLNNKNSSRSGAIFGGNNNTLSYPANVDTRSVIVGGTGNTNTGFTTSIFGGDGNQLLGFNVNNSSIIGGYRNIINVTDQASQVATNSIIVGGSSNKMTPSSGKSASHSIIAGGTYNEAGDSWTYLFGGQYNTTLNTNTTTVGGQYLRSGSTYETVLGSYNALTTKVGSILNWVGTEPLLQLGNGSSEATRNNALTILKNGHTAIGVIGTETAAKPTELLDLGGAATANNGGLRIRNINSAAYTGNINTDKLVVADATGVLKTVPMLSPNNIYNANGTLTAQRTVTMGDKQLAFVGDHQETTMSVYSGLLQEGRTSSPYGQGSIAIYGADKNANGDRTALSLQAFADGGAQIYAYEEASSLNIGTHGTKVAAPISFVTSAGSDALGTEKMRITGAGNVGIATDVPSEKLDVADGNLRVRNINTNLGASSDKIVVADANGVLKTVATVTAAPQFFYSPSLVLPTSNTNLPSYVTYSAGTFTVNLHGVYASQFGMTGNVSGATRTALKSPTATTLPVLGAAALEYFVTYFDNTVFDPASITLSDAGVLTYQVLSSATVTEKTYMNIVFKVK